MPADEYFENAGSERPPFVSAREALRRSPGYSPDRERNPWGDVPQHLRLDWCRALLDFPTFFPGAAWMAFTARTIREDKVSKAVGQWAWQADDFHRIGFSAADWYVLRLCIDRRIEKLLARDDGRFVIDTTRYEYRTIALIAEHWTDWLPLRRAGLTPKRALDLVVDGDRRSWPGGFLIDRDGNIIMSA
ncbi:hypothetical protein [Agromyces humatus]|uniref:Uncharacterized protein n=1 Tax=Agromyces humatus TaxID=279573 RepID=A0ABN2KKU9_9MICO|nr:hypothetical protein [Agromyces humatus]